MDISTDVLKYCNTAKLFFTKSLEYYYYCGYEVYKLYGFI